MQNPTHTKNIAGRGCTATLHWNGLSVGFHIHEHEFDQECEVGDEIMEGFVKWDGCSNWMTDDYAHFCERQQLLDLGFLLAALWDWAAELMGDKWEG